jgi:hypothetical protein
LRALFRRHFLKVCLRLTVPICGDRAVHTLRRQGTRHHYHLLQGHHQLLTRTFSPTLVSPPLHGHRLADQACSISMRDRSFTVCRPSSTAVSACSSAHNEPLEQFPRSRTRSWMHRILQTTFISISLIGEAKTHLALAWGLAFTCGTRVVAV